MTVPALALVQSTEPCPVCDGDLYRVFQLSPWGFHDAVLVGCPLCLPTEGSCRVWRRALEPFLDVVL